MSGSATAITVSGVQRLNTDLDNVFDRIQKTNLRVAELANQFGSPTNPTDSPPEEPVVSAPVVSTNDHVSNISRALSRLEQSISRIDNQ